MAQLENNKSNLPKVPVSCINCPPFTGQNSACNINLNNRRIVILGGRSRGRNLLQEMAVLDAISRGHNVLVVRPKNKKHVKEKPTDNIRFQRP